MPARLPYLSTILEAARDSGRSEREISRTATGQPAAISLIKTGRVPSVERVRRLCDALDLEFYIGPPRQLSPSMSQRGERQVRETRGPRVDLVDVTPLDREQAETDPSLLVVEGHDLLSTEARTHLLAKAALRHDLPVVEHIAQHVEVREIGIHGAENRVAFRRDWLEQRGIEPTKCIVLGVSGESMEPTVPDGSSILVDLSRKTLRNGGVFLVRTGGALVVKRADEDTNGQWLLVSDHFDWPDEPWPDDAAVFGEVRWVATLIA